MAGPSSWVSISSLATRERLAAAGAGVEEELATPVLPSSWWCCASLSALSVDQLEVEVAECVAAAQECKARRREEGKQCASCPCWKVPTRSVVLPSITSLAPHWPG